MTTELKLNTQAINTLFPEGSDTRVKLQQSVINNMARTLLTKSSTAQIYNAVNEESKQLTAGLENTIRSVCEEYVSISWNKTTSILGTTIGVINDRTERGVKDAISKHIDNEVQTHTNEALKGINERVDELVEERINRLSLNAIDQQVDKKIADIIAKLALEDKQG
jgi:hypothetical protein